MPKPYIIGFYSYRGGLGRSTALRNVAALLAGSGRRVLMVDFDLDSPGLTHMFHDELTPYTVIGVLDILIPELNRAPRQFQYFSARPASIPLPELPPSPYRPEENEPGDRADASTPPAGNRSRPARLALVPTGDIRSGQNAGLLAQLQGRRGEVASRSLELATKFRKELQQRAEFDYVLVDCRNGPSDEPLLTCGQLADCIVTLTGLTAHHAEGTAAGLGGPRGLLTSPTTVTDVVIVVSPTPVHHYDAVQRSLQEVRSILVARLQDHPASIDWGAVYDWRRYLTLTYDADVILDDGLFVADRWTAQLTQDYLRLHHRIREICKDDGATLTQSALDSLLTKDFERSLSALEDLAGLAVLEGNLAQANLEGIRKQVSAYLFNRPPADVHAAEALLEHLAMHEVDGHQSCWTLARIKSSADPGAATQWWDRAEHSAAVAKNETDLAIIQMERSQIEDRWGMGVLPGARRGQIRADMEKALSYQLPPSANLGVALTYHNLAELARLDDDFPKERTYLLLALEVHQRLGDARQEAMTWHSLGLLERLLGNYRVAERYLKKALEMKASSQDYHGMAVVRHSLGELYRLRGVWEAESDEGWSARFCFAEAEDLIKAEPDEGLGYILIRLSKGALLRDEEKREEAIKELRAALAIATSFAEDEARVERGLAKLYLEATLCEDDPARDLGELYTAVARCQDFRADLAIRAEIVLGETMLVRAELDDVVRRESLRVAEDRARALGLRALEADCAACRAMAAFRQGESAPTEGLSFWAYYDEEQVAHRLARKVAAFRPTVGPTENNGG